MGQKPKRIWHEEFFEGASGIGAGGYCGWWDVFGYLGDSSARY